MYYRHCDNNQVTFIVEGALVTGADLGDKTDIYRQVAEPKKVSNLNFTTSMTSINYQDIIFEWPLNLIILHVVINTCTCIYI